MISHAERPRPSESFTARDLKEEYMFYDRDGDRVHVLNATAREIYLLFDGTRTRDEVARAISERYDIDETTASADVSSLVDRLLELKLLTLT